MQDPYYDDEYDEDFYEDADLEGDPGNPDCWSQHFTLFRRDGKLWLSDVVLGGWFGVSWSFGYPDVTLKDYEFPLEEAKTRLQRPLKRIGKDLKEGEGADVTHLCRFALDWVDCKPVPGEFTHVYTVELVAKALNAATRKKNK